MNVPHLHRHVERFSDRELFVNALLGLISVARRVQRAVEATAAPKPTRPRIRKAAADESQDDPRLFALLGALAISSKLIGELETWRQHAAPTERATRPYATGLLR